MLYYPQNFVFWFSILPGPDRPVPRRAEPVGAEAEALLQPLGLSLGQAGATDVPGRIRIVSPGVGMELPTITMPVASRLGLWAPVAICAYPLIKIELKKRYNGWIIIRPVICF
jgi:hypothetical protein